MSEGEELLPRGLEAFNDIMCWDCSLPTPTPLSFNPKTERFRNPLFKVLVLTT